PYSCFKRPFETAVGPSRRSDDGGRGPDQSTTARRRGRGVRRERVRGGAGPCDLPAGGGAGEPGGDQLPLRGEEAALRRGRARGAPLPDAGAVRGRLGPVGGAGRTAPGVHPPVPRERPDPERQ